MQLGQLVNVRGVSHGSPPCLPAPAELFMNRAGDGFYRTGVTHSSLTWQHTMRHFTAFLLLAHNGVCGLQSECYRKHNTAAKIEEVMGWYFVFFFQTKAFQLLKLKRRSKTVISPFMERDNSLFTPAQIEVLRLVAPVKFQFAAFILAGARHEVKTSSSLIKGLAGCQLAAEAC